MVWVKSLLPPINLWVSDSNNPMISISASRIKSLILVSDDHISLSNPKWTHQIPAVKDWDSSL